MISLREETIRDHQLGEAPLRHRIADTNAVRHTTPPDIDGDDTVSGGSRALRRFFDDELDLPTLMCLDRRRHRAAVEDRSIEQLRSHDADPGNTSLLWNGAWDGL